MKLFATVTNTTNLLSITISESHSSPSASAVVTARSTTLELGDSIDIYLGYTTNYPKIFSGYVKLIEQNVPDNVYTITAYDEMIKATDFFIASSTPDTQYTNQNVSAENLVGDLLTMANVTSYSGGTTFFVFGLTVPIEVNLISSYNMCKTVADILAWHLWADTTKTVFFRDRKPYVMAGDTSSKTILTTDILKITHRISERDLRNRVVIYGYTGINSVAEAESPYLPAGFRKSVVVASPWIDDQTMADNAASYNLEKLNRLTEEVSVNLIGDPTLHARQIITMSESYTGVTGDWYVFSCEHSWGQSGYTSNIELRK